MYLSATENFFQRCVDKRAQFPHALELREREREVVYLVVSDESDEGVHVLVVDALAPLSEPEDAHLDRPAMSQHQEVEVEDPYTYEQAGMQDSVLAQVEVRSSGRARTPSQPRPRR